ncbi:MAG: polyphosphate polymerase domain-containing protein [Oscillospiraceae bacterium]|nr:polyphosphate polymerase domain-containing protein [Oscillospiraceae bacterium]
MQFRNELKFFMNIHTSEVLKRRVSAVMRPDSHSGGVYEVNNLYLDDQYDTCYNEKVLGSHVRDKYRVRFYNDDLSFIRFENKHKEGEMSYKNSLVMTEEEFNQITNGDMGFVLSSEHPLWQKVAAIHRLRRLRVSAVFSYTREAYIYEPGNVRVTFDSNLRSEKLLPEPYKGAPPGAGGMMEVKFDKYLPSVVKEMLDGLPVIQTAMSKYCYARERFGA